MKPRNKNNTQHKKKSKKKKDTKDEYIRVPRTAGLTQMCRELNLLPNTTQRKRIKDSIQRNILNRYITDGFRLNGQLVDLQYLSTYLQVPMTQIVRLVTRYQTEMAQLTGEPGKVEETYRAVMALAINNCLVDRGQCMQQTELLREAQDGHYVPFLSPALNKSLDTQLNSNKALLDLMRTMTPASGVTINNNNQQANMAADGQKSIGPNEATKMIDASREGVTLLTDDDLQLRIYAKNVEDKQLPEIVATRQQGFNMKQYGTTNIKLPTPTQEEHGDRSGDIDN
jgi:hypothetical protein